ncbi:MarR family winged helix-turn-helix transcriptional regulator [Bacillus chungangensis]|uniref:DNA-binding MarR family transcriptional regulator n=1 Tax=Bacillus chungangensis TaxID=587633 RepID=A0ABT9WTK8_9BACI|nr:MarR family transcriptional regulator [Bacillus chungangensis]MDQ0176617.1 DNA-binding MarR family transcriptional regulator [Bacillus chungangensis]
MEQFDQLNQNWTDIYYYLHYPHTEKISHQLIRILQQIDKESTVSIKQIAERLHISQNTASEHAKRLLERGYIKKERSSADERKVMLTLTDEGRECVKKNTMLDDEKLRIIWKSLSNEERKKIEVGFHILSKEAKKCFSSSK